MNPEPRSLPDARIRTRSISTVPSELGMSQVVKEQLGKGTLIPWPADAVHLL
jgi:hypothetical protein